MKTSLWQFSQMNLNLKGTNQIISEPFHLSLAVYLQYDKNLKSRIT